MLLLPLAVVGLVVAHVLLVRKHGVVPPFEQNVRNHYSLPSIAILWCRRRQLQPLTPMRTYAGSLEKNMTGPAN